MSKNTGISYGLLIGSLSVAGMAFFVQPALADPNVSQEGQVVTQDVNPDPNQSASTPEISEFYASDPIQTITVNQNISIPDDLLVTLLLSQQSKVSPIEINTLRKQSKSWAVVMQELKVNPVFLFPWLKNASVNVEGAWGVQSFNKFMADDVRTPLYDKVMRNMVGIDYLTRRYKLTPNQAMKALAHSRDAMEIIDAHANK